MNTLLHIIGAINIITCIASVVVIAHWWYDSGGEWIKHTYGRAIMLLMFMITIVTANMSVLALLPYRRIYLLAMALTTLMLMVSVMMFGYSRFKIQKNAVRSTRKEVK